MRDASSPETAQDSTARTLLARTRLAVELAAADEACVRNPFTNNFLLFALWTTDRLTAGDLSLDDIEAAVRDLTAEAFADRVARLTAYLDHPAPDHDRARLRALFAQLAEGGFEAYARALSCPPVGVVTTAHPTFALNETLSRALVELATGYAADGAPLDAHARFERLELARNRPHDPPQGLTLDVEHAWSTAALGHAADALAEARRIALEVARARWPDRWLQLTPRLATLATWVGFDQDGRTDITWDVSIGKRLALKQIALQRHLAEAETLGLDAAATMLRTALELVGGQIEALATACREGAPAVAAFARRLAHDRQAALCDPAPLIAEIETALAAPSPDECRRERLAALRATLKTQGAALAHIHVRVNAAQLHNAVRNEVGLQTSPTDPANRRAYFTAINQKIAAAEPQAVSFESLLAEPTSAKRLFITIAQMAKFVDAHSPVRFLIAETESGFTLLAALYFARLFGVDGLVEISPLFETQEAMHRGEAVIEEALKSPHYRAYLRAHGRLAVQFGFSDSGRYIGQMAATFRIERLRLRLAEMLEREGLAELEIVLFNTHGESIGRGGHPASLHDRLAYAAPARNRAEFAARNIRSREEDSFQGGDGYLPFFTPQAALATVRGLLSWAYQPALGDPEAVQPDPIYDAPGYASEFFATVEQAFSELASHPDYPALLGLFGPRLLLKTGSRPDRREQEGSRQVATFSRVSELRAIPNNGILQGLGQLANTTFGVSRAAAKDLDRFHEMRAASPRFRRALAMVETASALSDLQAVRAYAATVNPSLWLDRRAVGLSNKIVANLASLCERTALTGRLSKVLRQMRVEPVVELSAADDATSPYAERRARVRLLHAIRISLIQQTALLAERIPAFAPRLDVDREELRLQLLRLDILPAVAKLKILFPASSGRTQEPLDFGETATYLAAPRAGYAREEAELIAPLEQIHRLLLATTSALDHEMGACG
jgi:phosphoenolpyruvate carboxylase